ncbi:MAG: hypothetical protein JWN95_1346 [Frankiales bacterium]|nr:hypothetical protein [Frankiales bacterium]
MKSCRPSISARIDARYPQDGVICVTAKSDVLRLNRAQDDSLTRAASVLDMSSTGLSTDE